MKKTLLVPFILMGILGAEASGRERDLPIDKQLPDIGSDWVRRNGDGARGDFAWANFDHKTTGDVLSFVAWNVPPSTEVSDSLVGQASIEMFLENGIARPGTSKQGQPLSDTVRHRILGVRLRSAEAVRDIDVLEYTYVYDAVKDNPSTISHGYTLDELPFSPHVSANFDVISGDGDRNDGTLGTFNPLFPSLKYFGEAAVIAPYNLMDFHPSVAFAVTDRLTMSADIDFFWRYSTDDGLYGAGGQLLRSGAGSNARYISTQFELIADYEVTENLALNASYAAMPAGPFIQETGRSDTIHFVGLEPLLVF